VTISRRPIPVRAVGVIVAAILVATGPRSATQPVPRVIGSQTAWLRVAGGGSEQSLVVSGELRLLEISEAKADPARLAGVRPHDLGPFEAARYGFSSVHVYFDRTLPSEAERSMLSANATLRLVVATRGPGARRRWWQFDAPDDDTSGAIRLPPLSISDAPGDAELVALASSDASLPLLDVQYESNATGANSGVSLTRHLLLDLRGPIPRVVALLDDIDGFSGGICGGSSRTYEEIGCRWDGHDFLCAEVLHRNDTRWANRRGARRYWLSSGQRLPLPSHGGYETPIDFVGSLGAVGPVTFDSVGEVRMIGSTRSGDRDVAIAASPSLDSTFDPAFYVGVVGRSDGRRVFPKTVGESLGSHPLSPTQSGYTPDGFEELRFDVRRLASDGDVVVVQVTVTEGSARGVYLLGFEPGERLLADAIRIATTAATNGACVDDWHYPASAVAMTSTASPFSVTLDVEPANLERRARTREFALELVRDEGAACPSTTTVTWERGQGFLTRSAPRPCDSSTPTRLVTIDEHGALGAKPFTATP
jgi:hypothetical protein